MLPDPRAVERPRGAVYPPGVPRTYRYPTVAVTRFLDDAARDFPDAPALRQGDVVLGHAALRALVDRVAVALRDLGVAPGVRLATVAAPGPLLVAAAMATWRLGGVLVPLDPSAPAAVTTGRLERTGTALLWTDLDHVDDVLALALPPAVAHVVVADPVLLRGRAARLGAGLRARLGRRRVVVPEEGVVGLEDALPGPGAVVAQVPVAAADPAALLWPAGAAADDAPLAVAHAAAVAGAFQARLWIPDVRAGREVAVTGLPPWDPFGLVVGLLGAVLPAATLVLPEGLDGAALAAAATASRATLVTATPAQLAGCTDAARRGGLDLDTVRVALATGGRLPQGLRLAFEEVTGGRLRQLHGADGVAGATHANPVYGRTIDAAVGLPVTDTVAVVRDLDDPERALPADEVGELLVHGPQLATGVADDRGWLATGQLASIDADGWCRVHGRVVDAVRREGARVLPTEVEDAVRGDPGVADAVAVAVGAPDDRRLHVVVVPRRAGSVRLAQLQTHVDQVLDTDRRPDRLHLREVLPRTPSGTLLRDALAAELDDVGPLPTAAPGASTGDAPPPPDDEDRP